MSLTIYTVCGTNQGFYLALAVATETQEQAAAAFVPFLEEEAANGGNYICSEAPEARYADEDGDYPNEHGSGSLNLSGEAATMLLAMPGNVAILDTGANG